MVKKQYLCSGFKNRHNLFCTLKINRLIPWKNSRRETAFFMVLRSVSEAIPNRSRRETAFFMVLRSVSEAIPNRSRQKDGFFLYHGITVRSEAISYERGQNNGFFA